MKIMELLTVVGLGIVDVWIAIPTGLALQLSPVAVLIATATGEIGGSLIILLLGERARAWLLQRRGGEVGSPKHERVQRIVERYGAPGLGFLSPLIIGAPLGTALGLSLGVPARRLLVWMSLGAFFWCVVWTLLGAALGQAIFKLFDPAYLFWVIAFGLLGSLLVWGVMKLWKRQV